MTIFAGCYAAPRSIANIRTVADNFRSVFVLGLERLDVLDVLEQKLPALVPDFVYHVVGSKNLHQVEAFCTPNENTIVLPQKTYAGLRASNPRDRFTVMHEVGHLILHRGNNITLPRTPTPPRAFENPEWQADTFAAEVLMPFERARGITDVEEMMEVFGVSRIAGERRISKLHT